jgi:hypothetical protein
MGTSLKFRPQLEGLEDRLALSGGQVLPATAHPLGYTLTDMARATALFNTSNNDLSQYPKTPFQILYVDPATETSSLVNGGLVVTGSNKFTVAASTPFYVPVAFIDDSPPVLGTFPTDPSTVANYVFGQDQVGTTNLQIIVDGQVTPIGSAYAAGPVQTPPLLDGGGDHIITVGAFLTPLRPGSHTVAIAGKFSGVLFQQTFGLKFEQFNFTYSVLIADSSPVLGAFPRGPSTVANYVFAHDQVGTANLQIIVDGQATPIGSAFAAGPVQTPPLLDGGDHITTVGAFLTPLRPGTHAVAIAGESSGALFQQPFGLNFEQFDFT